tara:strand:+ start:7712 stop:9799 length:2088 start_codon:yes stop_codon:yes gene_type:complete
MKTKVLLRGPILTRSGYGEHTRFVARALRMHEDKFDIYIQPITWGKTSWLLRDEDDRTWVDQMINKTAHYIKSGGQFDLSLQVTIPNEWEKIAHKNIGITAGVESTKISPTWVEKSAVVDKIIVVSNHAKEGFVRTSYHATHKETGQVLEDFRCTTPVEVVNYPVKLFKPAKLGIKLDYDFNFLAIAQWGPRKNLDNTIKWFVEEFIDQEVGLVVKANIAKNNKIDRVYTTQRLQALLSNYPNRKCKVYLLHGEMDDSEIAALYKHPKIKAFVTTTHGEGYGLPIFEAAYSGMPIIAPDWGGHLDFVYIPTNATSGARKKAMFAKIDYTLANIQDEAVWEGVLEKESHWCYPDQGSYKMRLREVYKNYPSFKEQARELEKYILEEFEYNKMHGKMVSAIVGENIQVSASKYIFVSDYFDDQMSGGAEFSLGTLMKQCPDEYMRFNSAQVGPHMLEDLEDKQWIFGNYTQLNPQLIDFLIQKKISYNVVEFDYKFCRYRNMELHKMLENKECDCAGTDQGKTIENFLANAQNVFFMSDKQKQAHLDNMPSLEKKKCTTLSSVFDGEFFDKIKKLRRKYRNKKKDVWVISSSPSWMKGAEEAEKWCKDNKKEFIKLHGKSYDEALETLASAKGLCFVPTGGDTCPRLVIEAKLLGCDLHINENVQHADEKWFDTKDYQKTVRYLKKVPQKFWNSVGV